MSNKQKTITKHPKTKKSRLNETNSRSDFECVPPTKLKTSSTESNHLS